MKFTSDTQTGERVMTRSEFVDEVARKADLPRAAAERVVNAIFDVEHGAIAEAVDAEGSLSIRGFGRFTRETRPAGNGRSRRNGAKSGVLEGNAITFEPSRRLNGRAAGWANGTTAAQLESSDCDEITPEEAAIRRMLVKGFQRVRGIHIDNVFPGGWADDQIRG